MPTEWSVCTHHSTFFLRFPRRSKAYRTSPEIAASPHAPAIKPMVTGVNPSFSAGAEGEYEYDAAAAAPPLTAPPTLAGVCGVATGAVVCTAGTGRGCA